MIFIFNKLIYYFNIIRFFLAILFIILSLSSEFESTIIQIIFSLIAFAISISTLRFMKISLNKQKLAIVFLVYLIFYLKNILGLSNFILIIINSLSLSILHQDSSNRNIFYSSSFLIISVYAISTLYIWKNFPGYTTYKLFSYQNVFTNSFLDSSLTMPFLAIVTLDYLIRNNRSKLVILLLAIFILITGRRMVFLLLFISIGLRYFNISNSFKKILLITVNTIYIFGLLTVSEFVNDISFSEIRTNDQSAASSIERIGYVNHFFKEVKEWDLENFLFGDAEIGKNLKIGIINQHFHNSFLTLFGYLGLLGIILTFILFFYKTNELFYYNFVPLILITTESIFYSSSFIGIFLTSNLITKFGER